MENCFCLLNSVLRLYESNFRNLHWNSAGNEFNDAHKSITTDYYDMIGGDIDKIAEIIAMLGENAPNYIEVLDIIKNQDKNFLIIDSSALYSREEIIKFADIMLNDICILLSCCLESEVLSDPMNAGIKSELESILYNYTLEARYINKRRNA